MWGVGQQTEGQNGSLARSYLPTHPPPPPTVTNLHKCPLIWISHRHFMKIFFFWNKSATVSGSLALHLHIQFAPSRGIYFSFIGYWLHYIYGNFKCLYDQEHYLNINFFFFSSYPKIVVLSVEWWVFLCLPCSIFLCRPCSISVPSLFI